MWLNWKATLISRNYPDIGQLRVSWWTHFGCSKSMGYWNKIHICNDIISNDYVKIGYTYWKLIYSIHRNLELTNVK